MPAVPAGRPVSVAPLKRRCPASRPGTAGPGGHPAGPRRARRRRAAGPSRQSESRRPAPSESRRPAPTDCTRPPSYGFSHRQASSTPSESGPVRRGPWPRVRERDRGRWGGAGTGERVWSGCMCVGGEASPAPPPGCPPHPGGLATARPARRRTRRVSDGEDPFRQTARRLRATASYSATLSQQLNAPTSLSHPPGHQIACDFAHPRAVELQLRFVLALPSLEGRWSEWPIPLFSLQYGRAGRSSANCALNRAAHALRQAKPQLRLFYKVNSNNIMC